MNLLVIFGVLWMVLTLVSGQVISSVVTSGDGAFSCKTGGAFPDLQDNSKFYYCVPIGNGFISTLISCSSGYVFDDKSSGCIIPSMNQGGANDPETSTESNVVQSKTVSGQFTCPGLGSFSDPLSIYGFFYCISDDDGGYIAIRISCGKGTEYIPEIETCGIPGEDGSTTPNPGTDGTTFEPEPFVCPGSGLYPSPFDKRKFYYCLSDEQGGYISIEFTCGSGTEFIPELSECGIVEESTTVSTTTTTESTSIIMPTSTEETTQEATITSTDTTEESTTTLASSTTQPAISSTTQESTEQPTVSSFSSTTDLPTSTTEEPETTTDPSAGFVCPDVGLFPNPESKTSFYLCLPDGDGGYIKILMECSKDQEFDPEQMECLDKEMSTTEPSESSTTPDSSTTPTTIEPPIGFVCPGEGLFPNPESKTSFYLCLPDGDGGYIKILMECSKDQEFDPEQMQCMDKEMSTTEPSESSTTPDSSTTPTTTEPPIGFVCPGEGLFPNPESKTSFYLCLPDGDGGYIKILMECSKDQEFDPEQMQCMDKEMSTTEPSESSTMPESSTTPSSSTTPTSSTMPGSSTTPIPFKCTEQGIFADPSDATKYYYCSPDGQGGLREILMTCPLGLVFDPAKKYCSKPNQPFLTTTTTSTTTPSVGTFACTRAGMFEDPKNNRTFYVCIFDGFGFISVLMECSEGLVFIQDLYRCAPPDTPKPPSAPIKCNGVGYVPDPNSCRIYYYCYSTFDGGYLTVRMTCPAGTNFYPNMEICVSDRVLKCDINVEEGSGSGPEPTSSTAAIAHFGESLCRGPGLFPVLGNNRAYYSCDFTWNGSQVLKTKECDKHSRFSDIHQKCVKVLDGDLDDNK